MARPGRNDIGGRRRKPGAEWPRSQKKGLAFEAAPRHAGGMDQTPQLAAQITPWLTPVVLLTVLGLMWRSMLRLEDRLGKRIDDTSTALGKRIDRVSESLGARIDGIDGRLRTIESTQAEIKGKLDFVEAYILGRNDTGTVPAE